MGMEAPGYARWFERLVAKLGIEVWISDAAKIKTKRVRKQKTDRRPGCRTSTEAAAGRTFSSNPGYAIRRIGSAAIALASATTGADEDAVSSVGHAAPARFVGVAGRTRALIAREAFGFPRLATKLLTKHACSARSRDSSTRRRNSSSRSFQGGNASLQSICEIILGHLRLIWLGLTRFQSIWLTAKSP